MERLAAAEQESRVARYAKRYDFTSYGTVGLVSSRQSGKAKLEHVTHEFGLCRVHRRLVGVADVENRAMPGPLDSHARLVDKEAMGKICELHLCDESRGDPASGTCGGRSWLKQQQTFSHFFSTPRQQQLVFVMF